MAPKKPAKAASPKVQKPTRTSPRKTTATNKAAASPSRIAKKSASKPPSTTRRGRPRSSAPASPAATAANADLIEHSSGKSSRTTQSRIKTAATPVNRAASNTQAKSASSARHDGAKQTGSPSKENRDDLSADMNATPAERHKGLGEYGRIMRFMVEEAFLLEFFGKKSSEYEYHSTGVDKGDGNKLNPDDYHWCLEEGRRRAIDRKRKADHVDHTGLLQGLGQKAMSSHVAKVARPTLSTLEEFTSGTTRRSPSKSPAKEFTEPSPTKSTSGSIRRSRSKSPSKKAPAPSPTGTTSENTRRSRSKSPAKNDDGTTRRSRSKSPAKKDDFTPLSSGQPSKEGHGGLISPTNQQFLKHNGKLWKKNYFFETMPAKEVWHCNLPPLFTFGETPRMEQEVSLEIEKDLRGTHEVPKPSKPKEGFFGSIPVPFKLPSLPRLWGGTGPTPEPEPEHVSSERIEEEAENPVWTMWNLPALSEEEKPSITQRSD